MNNPYLSTFLGNSRLYAKHKSSNPSNYTNNKRTHSINRNEGNKEKEEAIRINNHRTASSFKKGLSTVYNITFQDKRNEFRPI